VNGGMVFGFERLETLQFLPAAEGFSIPILHDPDSEENPECCSGNAKAFDK
jgi:hypothetical protein